MKKVVFSGQRLFMKFPDLSYFEKRVAEVEAMLVAVRDQSQEKLKDEVREASALVVINRPVTAEIIQAMQRCRLILTLSVGHDCVDVRAATKKRIPVSNSPAYCTDDVANHALTLLLALSRKIHLILPRTRKAVWDYKYTRPIFNLLGKTLGLIGLGKIGRAMVPKARALGLKLSAYDPYLDDDLFELLGVERKYEIDDLLRASDYLSIHAPLTPETHHLIDFEALGKMKRRAVLINTARGAIVDEEALLQGLKEGLIAGAGLDVLEEEPPSPNHPLLSSEKVLITPHVAWYSEESFEANMVQGMDELVRVLGGGRPRYIVNPEIFGQ